MNRTVDDLGSYVMSALTATVAGGQMTAHQVCDRIVDNGWAEHSPALDSAVTAKMDAMCAAGSVVRIGAGYAMSPAAVESILGQLSDGEE